MVVSEQPQEDAERLLRSFMKRAYRRVPEESEVQRCLAFAVQAIDDKACFQDAMRLAYKAVLCSPDFLYLQETAGQTGRLCSRGSFVLHAVAEHAGQRIDRGGRVRRIVDRRRIEEAI